MITPPKLFFDECFGQNLCSALLEEYGQYYPGLEIDHVLNHYDRGTCDSEWLPRLAAESDRWIVVSKDLGVNGGLKNGVQKPKLPRLCEGHKIRHICTTKKFAQQPKLTLNLAAHTIMVSLPHLYRLTPGTRIKMGFQPKKGSAPVIGFYVGGATLETFLGRAAANG